jgi:hypothetical protein
MELDEAKALAKLFASKFIARPDIMAVQTRDGEYRPTRDLRTKEVLESFSMRAILDHLEGDRTLGHYMIGPGNQVKLFALDLDLEKTGKLPDTKFGDQYLGWKPCNPREEWMSRKQGPGREVTKYQFRMMAHSLARIVEDELGIPVAVAYSGSKGVHIYGFTGPTTAARARKGAQIVLEAAGWVLSRGNNFYRFNGHKGRSSAQGGDLLDAMENFSVEVYPKQDTMDDKDLGNLMRLPLGVNLKSPKDTPFFLDLRTAMTDFRPMDPIEALTTDNIWRYSGE